jgi:hypothetical protein
MNVCPSIFPDDRGDIKMKQERSIFYAAALLDTSSVQHRHYVADETIGRWPKADIESAIGDVGF